MNTKRIAALILAAVMTLLFTACGSKTVINDDGTKTEQKESGVKVTQQKESGVKVTQTAAKAVQTEKYESADFSMTIPKRLDGHDRRNKHLSQYPCERPE